MSETDILPEVKQIVGAMLFASRQPLNAKQIKSVFPRVSLTYGGMTEQFGEVRVKDIEEALEAFRVQLEESNLGFKLVEVAGGFRLQNDKVCGPWLRELLEKGKPQRLSRPALETLSIIAYRQPLARSEVEAIRGVASDSIVRTLLEMQLIKVVGRSEMPGKPWLYGTTNAFLEYFGLKSMDDLPGLAELGRSALAAPDLVPPPNEEDAQASLPLDDGEEAEIVAPDASEEAPEEPEETPADSEETEPQTPEA